jgi:hypothetical protein
MTDKSVIRTQTRPSDVVKFALNMFSGLKARAKTRAAHSPLSTQEPSENCSVYVQSVVQQEACSLNPTTAALKTRRARNLELGKISCTEHMTWKMRKAMRYISCICDNSC